MKLSFHFVVFDEFHNNDNENRDFFLTLTKIEIVLSRDNVSNNFRILQEEKPQLKSLIARQNNLHFHPEINYLKLLCKFV